MNNTLGCVIMAAGNSSRFGNANKLLQDFNDQTIIERTLNAIPFPLLDRCVLVANSESIIEIACKFNIQVLINTKPELGIGRTIKLGTTALGSSYNGYMYVVGDQPLLTKASITNLIDFWKLNPENIVSLGFGKRIGNPFIFPKTYFDELLGLEDNEYGRVIYHRHLDQLKTVQVPDEYELMDVDTIEDFDVLLEHIKKSPAK